MKLDFYSGEAKKIKKFLDIDLPYTKAEIRVCNGQSNIKFKKNLKGFRDTCFEVLEGYNDSYVSIKPINNIYVQQAIFDVYDAVRLTIHIKVKDLSKEEMVNLYSFGFTPNQAENFRLKKKCLPETTEDDMIEIIKKVYEGDDLYIEACINHTEIKYTGPYAEFLKDMEIIGAKEFDLPLDIKIYDRDVFWSSSEVEFLECSSACGKTPIITIPAALHCICGRPKYTSHGDGFRYGDILVSKSGNVFKEKLQECINAYCNDNIPDIKKSTEHGLFFTTELQGLFKYGIRYYKKNPKIIYDNHLNFAFDIDELEKTFSSISKSPVSFANYISKINKPNMNLTDKLYDFFVHLDEFSDLVVTNVDDVYADQAGVTKIIAKNSDRDIVLVVLEFENGSYKVIEQNESSTNYIINNKKTLTTFIEGLSENEYLSIKLQDQIRDVKNLILINLL